MSESGGPATQSGIFYQNSVAALYLGELLELRTPVGKPRVISVRVEAPEHVDDIVVSYADSSTVFIQAKEQITVGGEPWKRLWASLRKQSANLRSGRDQFLLIVGNTNGSLEHLRETMARARGKESIAEWQATLNKPQIRIANLILDELGMAAVNAFDLIQRTRVDFLPLSMIETTGARDAMPDSSDSRTGLHARLRDICGAGARMRKVFRAADLSELLLARYGVHIHGSHGDGMEQYRLAIAAEFDHIAVPGTAVSAREQELLVWPRIELANKSDHADFEDEDPWRPRALPRQTASLQDFPAFNRRHIVLESGAGHGKSTLLKATARRLAASTAFVPAYIHAEALNTHSTIPIYLSTQHNARYQVALDWTALLEQGRAIVLIDGIDELNDGTRAVVVDSVKKSAARYPGASFLLGARDASIADLPPQFELFRLQRLDDEQMVAMLRRYLGERDPLDAQRIIQNILQNQELELLCCIPLFLAIFCATLPKDGPIPASRKEVLERYIHHVLSPERHKAILKSSLALTQLRQSAESLALLVLDENQSTISESSARATLSKDQGRLVGDECVDTLLRYGLIERRGTCLAFSIPTVQEYLAGCVLADSGRIDSGNWIESIYKRPWAQAVQYAIEKIKTPSGILHQQLRREDDAFFTRLRLVGRCIANGATVEAELKREVAQRLAIAWSQAPYETSRKIGRLIADGFSNPMHPAIRKELVDGGNFWLERAEVIAKAKDNQLTLQCLDLLLRSEDIRDLWDPAWTQLIKDVPQESVQLLLKRAASEGSSTLTASVIAHSLYVLRDDLRIDWCTLSSDPNLPLVVRAVASFGCNSTQIDRQIEVIDAALAESPHRMWREFVQAYVSTSWWREHMRTLCSSPSETGLLRLMSAIDDVRAPPQLLEHLEVLAFDAGTCAANRLHLQTVLGGLGDIEFAAAATEALRAASLNQIIEWAAEAPYLPLELVAQGISILSSRLLSSADQIKVLSSVLRATEYEPSHTRTSLGARGPFTRRNERPSEIISRLLEWAERLYEAPDLTHVERHTLTRICARCGSKRAVRDLVAYVDGYLAGHPEIDKADWNEFAMTCGDIEESGENLSIDTLWQIVQKGPHLPVGSTLEKLIQREGASCYPQLIDYFEHGKSADARHAIIRYFERTAERQGLKVQREGRRLQISKVP